MTDTAHALVLGSGVAGLYFAINAATQGRVIVCSRGALDDGSTARAQGGIAAVTDATDDVAAHVQDTLNVGAGLSRRRVVERIVKDAPACIRSLEVLGLHFDRATDGTLDRALEGGHSAHRVVHVRDATGRALHAALLACAREHPNIELREDHTAIHLIQDPGPHTADRRCVGALLIDRRAGLLFPIFAENVVLATGGAGALWPETSNPPGSVGNGIALAFEAGAIIANPEFVQFHPTLLAVPGANGFLITEALRGEGAVLRREDGSPLMDGIHPLASLAPRDIVARTIAYELRQTGESGVLLDATGIAAATLERRFPSVLSECVRLGFDPRNEPLRVGPGAHYLCGGIDVDAMGRTAVPGLFALGETAHTGMHGACRLASNSLSEALVCATYAARAARETPRIKSWTDQTTVSVPINTRLESESEAIMTRLVSLMGRNAGVLRDANGLQDAAAGIENLVTSAELGRDGSHTLFAQLGLSHALQTASLIVQAALRRRESRGVHYRVDHPEAFKSARNTLLSNATIRPIFPTSTLLHAFAFSGTA